MDNLTAPDGLARFDLVLDAELWQRLKQQAEQRGSDPAAFIAWLLMQQTARL